MTVLHAGYPQPPTVTFPHHQVVLNNGPVVVVGNNRQKNTAVGGAYHLQHDENNKNIVGGLRDYQRRRVSDASSDGSFENMSRPAYTGRDTDRFFGGGEFELDDEDDDMNGLQHQHHYGGYEYHADDDDVVEDEDEPLAELAPIGGGTRRVPRTPRRKSTSYSKCGFFDFYKLTSEHLGSGAYGSVTTCVAISTGIEYAVKIVGKAGETHSRKRILREVKIFQTCKNHPNIVQLIDWYEDEENFYLVMEKMRGGPLLQHILEKGYFTEEEARRVTKDIATALKFMHDRGIAHRDVKPENVLCTGPDQVSPVKLCDLDLASQRQDRQPLCQVASEPDLASPVGSAEFMAPEVVDAFVGDALKYDKKCDTWSLGVILYIMLAGYAPFQGECDDENCGWSEGTPCPDCQEELFHRIQSGIYDFPEEEWDMISGEARDLVINLLKRDPTERFNADQILSHPWLLQSAPPTFLQTPSNLGYRKDSMQNFSETFNVMNRMAPRISARFDKENGGATATVNDSSFLLGGGEPFGTFPRVKSNTNAAKIEKSRSGDFTPPISRASPTTPPPSMINLSKCNENGIYSMFTPETPLDPLSPLYFGLSPNGSNEPVQLFGGGSSAKNMEGLMNSSLQMTPRQTTEDELSFSPENVENIDRELSNNILCFETKVNV